MRFRVVLLERRNRVTFDAGIVVGPSSWYWRLMSAGNNKTLAHSETYSAKHDAVRTAEALADALGVILETDAD